MVKLCGTLPNGVRMSYLIVIGMAPLLVACWIAAFNSAPLVV